MNLIEKFKKSVKKYDINRDHLTIEMPLNMKGLGIYKDGVEIDLESCNNRTKEAFQKRRNEYKARMLLRRDKLKATGNSFGSFEILSLVNFTLSDEMEKLLMPLIKDEDSLLGICRAGTSNENAIQDMLNNGVILSGHGFNVVLPKPDLGLNFGIYQDNQTILKEIAYADSYKNSKGSIIISIPIEDLKKEFYYKDENNSPRINPKYIVGYFPVNKSRCIDSVIFPSARKEINEEESSMKR